MPVDDNFAPPYAANELNNGEGRYARWILERVSRTLRGVKTLT